MNCSECGVDGQGGFCSTCGARLASEPLPLPVVNSVPVAIQAAVATIPAATKGPIPGAFTEWNAPNAPKTPKTQPEGSIAAATARSGIAYTHPGRLVGIVSLLIVAGIVAVTMFVSNMPSPDASSTDPAVRARVAAQTECSFDADQVLTGGVVPQGEGNFQIEYQTDTYHLALVSVDTTTVGSARTSIPAVSSCG